MTALLVLQSAGSTPADAQSKGPTAPAKKGTSATKETWQPLFDGKTLKDWSVTKFGGEGAVVVRRGVIQMEMGSSLTGITYVEKLPKRDYEVRVEAKRINGIDFFSTITFPVNDSFCSLVVGGWAGAVVGISCVNLADASENETTSYHNFATNRWYRIRIQVRQRRIRAWIDDKPVVDLDIEGRKLSTRAEVALNEPFGISCWETSAEIRRIELRKLPPEDRHEKKPTPNQ